MKFYQFLLEIDAYNGTTVETLEFSGKPTFAAGWLPYIDDPGLIQVDMFQGGKTHGKSNYSYGEIILNNIADEANGETEGPLDYLKSYGFDGRVVRLFQGLHGDAYGEFTLVLTATIESITFEWQRITLSLRSRQVELDVPLDSGIFAGDNVLPAGLEGTSEDLEGKPKPILFGRVLNAAPVLCNTSKLIYAISPANGIETTHMGAEFNVYDNGVPLTAETIYTDTAALEANQPSPGCYRVYEAGGYFRLGSSPTGTITFDGCSAGRSVTGKASNLIQDVLAQAGHASMIDSSSFDTVAISTLPEHGIYITSQTNISDIIDELCAGSNIYWHFNSLGRMVLGSFVDPSTLTIDHALDVSDIVEDFTIMAARDTEGGVPTHTVSMKYAKNYTPSGDLAGSVSASRRAWLEEEWRTLQATDPTVLTEHLLSEEMVIETTLIKPPSDEVVAALFLYGFNRDIIEFKVPLKTYNSSNDVRLGLCFGLTFNGRYGLTDKKMVLIGYTVNYVTEELILILWG